MAGNNNSETGIDVITVHHLENSRSQRILWLLEEMGVDYEVKQYKGDAVTSLAPPDELNCHSTVLCRVEINEFSAKLIL